MCSPTPDRPKHHAYRDILTIAVCAIICGADFWVEVERFDRAKLAWFRSFLALPNGIPSPDTFGTSREGRLIQATVGSFGGAGHRWANRAGWVA